MEIIKKILCIFDVGLYFLNRAARILTQHGEQSQYGYNNFSREQCTRVARMGRQGSYVFHKFENVDRRFDSLDLSLKNIESKMSDMDVLLTDMQQKVREIEEALEFASSKANEAMSAANSAENCVQELKQKNLQFANDIDSLKKGLLDMDCITRKNNLIFEGIDESENETRAQCEGLLKQKLLEKLNIDAEEVLKFDRVHRLGKKFEGKSRPILAAFQTFSQKNVVWSKRTALKGTNIWMNEDFPQSIRTNRKQLLPVFLAARKCENLKKLSLKLDVLQINGKNYTVENMHELPDEIKLNSRSTTSTDKVTVFSSRNAVLGNPHEMDVMTDGRIFNTNE